MSQYNYEPERCQCCGQVTTYLLPLDWGTAVIVKAVAAAVRLKGINVIHPRKEMEMPDNGWTYRHAVNHGKLTSNQIGNLSRAKAHGLIAQYKKEPGNWLLTAKGAAFLRGETVPKLKIRYKNGVEHEEMTYWMPEKYKTTIHELIPRGKDIPAWEGIDFDIIGGRIVVDLEEGSTQPIFAN